jgi:hypothetical protein
MSDVQCPAVILLLTPDTIDAPELHDRRLSGVVVAQTLQEHSRTIAKAQQHATANGCKLEFANISDAAGLEQQANQLADLYRGETIAVVAPSEAICAAFHRTTPPTQPIAVAIDNSGWNLLT